MNVKSQGHSPIVVVILVILTGIFSFSGVVTADPPAEKAEISDNLPKTIEDARARARWMHEIVHGALQVMHRDFFEEDGTTPLPSQSLDDVFDAMADLWSVKIRWLGVNANKGKDHLPKTRFEEQAAEALNSGKKEYESTDGTQYRFAGAIRLPNQCLKCHVPDRTSLEERVAGLVITFPMQTSE